MAPLALTQGRLSAAQPAAARLPSARRAATVVRAALALPADVKRVAPVGDRVLVKVLEAESTSSGGILLPSSAQSRPTTGAVVEAGSAKAVSAGDRVVYSKYAGTELDLQKAPHVLLKEDDVIGTLSGDDISTLRPLGDRVLIRGAEAAAATAGGLLLTAAAQDKPTIGTVVAVGPGKAAEGADAPTPVAVKVGDQVLYSKYSGSEFEGPAKEPYIVVREGDILAAVA